MARQSLAAIERALIKKYRRYIWTRFIRAIKDYQLLEPGDRVAVAISGGKDSLLLAKLFQELQTHGNQDFGLEFMAMDPGYLPANRQRLEANLDYLGIPTHIYETDIFEVSGQLAGAKPCYLCARMRRGALYARAQELGCNKLALGHHFDDVIETILLNVLCSANYKTMMPKLKSDNFEGLELIRPLYLVEEASIISWIQDTGLQALDCACTVTQKEEGSMRQKIKELIRDLDRQGFTNVRHSIFRSAENVSLGAVLGYEEGGIRHHFLDDY